MTTFSVRLGVLTAVLTLGTGLPAAPVIAEEPTAPPLSGILEAGLVVDRDTYPAGGTVRATVVLTNFGDAEVRGITARCGHNQDGPELRGGEGWGALAEGAAGVVVPANSTRIVAVSEPVPQASPRHGYVSASCGFRATGYGEEERAEATARVPGLSGSGRGRIFQDHNGNGRLDDGEAIAGLPVVLTDPRTGVPVGRWGTDEHGGFAVSDVPAARYDVRFAGPWKAKSTGWYEFPVVAGEPLADLDFAVEPGEHRLPNLTVSATFDKQAYNSGDDVRARITVTNIGEAAAEGARVSLTSREFELEMFHDETSWGEFASYGPGARIEVGASRTIEIVGAIRNPDEPVVILSGGFVTANSDIGPADRGFYLVAPVTMTYGTLAGIVYGDGNISGAMDPGEALGSAQVELLHHATSRSVSTTTDAKGGFAFRDIPTGRYQASYHVLGGYLFQTEEIVVDEGVNPDILVRVERPLSEFLTVSVKFAKNTYAVGETAHLTVTMTNRGPTSLTGIMAMCGAGGLPYQISGEADGWGELATVGVTIDAGETRMFDVSSSVPDGAFNYGYVSASCVFAASLEKPGYPEVDVRARVPGGTGLAVGDLIHEGEGVPDTKVLLLDEDTGAAVARATSDASGRLEFGNVPAGRYGVRVVGPWKVRQTGGYFEVLAGPEPSVNLILVEPGPNQPDPDTPPETEQPSPQGGVAPPAAQTGGGGGLASTGASVIGLLIMALAALAVGLGLVLVQRRTS